MIIYDLKLYHKCKLGNRMGTGKIQLIFLIVFDFI